MAENITIVGTGMMGVGIGTTATSAGHKAVVHNVESTKTENGVRNCISSIDQLFEGGLDDAEFGETA